MPDISQKYWPLYCEENVWQLCNALPKPTTALALLISNPDRAVALWHQRAAPDPDQPILWDYHVILGVEQASGWTLIDPDSTLDSPCPADIYLRASFPELPDEQAGHRPVFRSVPADVYLKTLCSDRSHMRTPDGGWQSPPPPWPCIGEGTNLMRFVDMRDDFIGQVFDLAGLRAALGLEPR
jgi:hypothetical protein